MLAKLRKRAELGSGTASPSGSTVIFSVTGFDVNPDEPNMYSESVPVPGSLPILILAPPMVTKPF